MREDSKHLLYSNCKNQVQEFWALYHLGSQFICSGFKDFLQRVVLGRETQSNTQPENTLSLTVFPQFFWPPSSPNFLLFIAKVSGEIMITITVSATKGPVLFG